LNQYYIEGAKTEIIKLRKNLVKFNLHSVVISTITLSCSIRIASTEIEWGPVKRPLFDGVGWKIFNKIFTVNVIANGLGHILDIEKATSARSVDAKIFKQEDARVRQMLLERLSKRLIREVRSCRQSLRQ
jgi:hypothetical protein